MKAFIWEGLDLQPRLRDDLPAPTPAPGRVLVRVQASSINPVDGAIASGMLKDMAEHRFPVTLGRDFAGVVEAAGDQLSNLSAGDEVFGIVPGMDPVVHDGAWAELIVVPETAIAHKPSGVDFEAAGAVGLAGATALVAVDALKLTRGDTLLIVGATGGVGSSAVQLAVAAEATVIAPAWEEDEKYLRGLGVSEVVPRDADVVKAVHEHHPDGVEAILDLVSFTPGAYEEALKAGGRVASTLNAAGEGPGRTNVGGLPSPEVLHRLAELLESDTLVVHIQQIYPLQDVAQAMQALGSTHKHGKLAVRVA